MKYQYEDNIKEVLKIQKEVSDELNQKIFGNLSAAEKNVNKTYFYLRKSVTCALMTIVVFLFGGIGISYAAGVKPVRTILDQFTQKNENDINKDTLEGTTLQAPKHKLDMSEHYLDNLGYGYMAFSLSTNDGERESNIALGDSLEAYYTDADHKRKEFVSYEISPVYSEGREYFDGVQLSFYGSQFMADNEDIVIKIEEEIFKFSDINITQPHYYEWISPEGNVYLSGVGLLAAPDTPVENYISSLIGTDKDTGQIATVTYKDGHQECLQLNAFCGGERSETVIQFSPWTQLQKHLEEGLTWEEVEEEWKYNFSIYTFALDEVSKLQIGDIVLDVAEASYR